MNASARTMQLYKKEGIPVWSVERYIAAVHRRIDLFNLFDLIALDMGIVGIQVTTSTNHSGHKQDLMMDQDGYAKCWLRNGGHIELHSWGKRKVKRGGKAVRWTLRKEVLTQEDFNGQT